MNVKATSSAPSRLLKTGVVLFLLLMGLLTLINPPYPHEMYLQHSGTVLLLAILIIDIKKNYLYLSSFLGIAAMTGIHIFAARWLYTYVPYNEWFKELFNFDFQAYFGFKRNHFDRFVHFLFGIFVWPFLIQVLGSWRNLKRIQVILIAWLMIQTSAMIYELFEWSLTLVLSTEAADNYNGQQGDWWDSQKDMSLSLLSSTIMGLISLFRKKHKP